MCEATTFAHLLYPDIVCSDCLHKVSVTECRNKVVLIDLMHCFMDKYVIFVSVFYFWSRTDAISCIFQCIIILMENFLSFIFFPGRAYF